MLTSLSNVLYTSTYSTESLTPIENVGTAYGPTSVITTIEQMSANDTMQVYLNSCSSHGNSNGQFYGYLIG